MGALTGTFAARGRVWVAVALAVVSLAWPARAQMGMGMESMGAMLPISRRNLETYGDLLGLSAEQRAQLVTLYEGYRASTRERMEHFAKEMEKSMSGMEDGWATYVEKLPEMIKRFTEEVQKREQSFFEDARLLLTAEQEANWPRIERARRRQQYLRFGLVAGQSVDLVETCAALGIDTRKDPAVAEQIDAYEAAMDRHTLAMERLNRKSMEGDSLRSMMSGDMDAVQSMMKEVYDLGAQTRDTNRTYVRRLVPLLGEPTGPKLEAEFQKRSFPRIYKPSSAQETLDVAMGLADLTPEQRAELVAIGDRYRRDAAPANAKWAAAIEERQNKFAGDFVAMSMELSMSMFGDDEPKDPVSLARKARLDLDTRTRERIAALLTPDQVSRLPEIEEEEAAGFEDIFSFDLDQSEWDDWDFDSIGGGGGEDGQTMSGGGF